MQDEGIEFHEGLPSSIYINTLSDCLLVLDDLMDVAMNDKKLMSLCTEGSHHKNISVVFIMQNLYPHGRESKTISLNITYLVLYKMIRDKQQVQTLARQLFPGKMGEFMDYYDEMTSKPYGKLILDLHPRTPDNQRYIQDKVTFDNIGMEYDANTSDDSDLEALEFFKNQEEKNRQIIQMTNPYLSAALDEQKKISQILQDPTLDDDQKVILLTQAQQNSRIYRKYMDPVQPPTVLAPVTAPVPAPRAPVTAPRAVTPPPERKPTLVGLVKEDIPYEDLPVPTQQELSDDSGDENHMDNFASLSDSEEMENIKNLRADYNFRDRVRKKRANEERVRADRFNPYK